MLEKCVRVYPNERKKKEVVGKLCACARANERKKRLLEECVQTCEQKRGCWKSVCTYECIHVHVSKKRLLGKKVE